MGVIKQNSKTSIFACILAGALNFHQALFDHIVSFRTLEAHNCFSIRLHVPVLFKG